MKKVLIEVCEVVTLALKFASIALGCLLLAKLVVIAGR